MKQWYDNPRTRRINSKPVVEEGRYVLYWMQASQRADDNAALHHATRLANRLERPVLAAVVIDDDYPEASARHFAFMLQGLAHAHARLSRLGIRLIGLQGGPPEPLEPLLDQACAVVIDAGYLRHLRRWREALVARCPVALDRVEADVIVPVEAASPKAEYAARTFRKKIEAWQSNWLHPSPELAAQVDSRSLSVRSDIDLDDASKALSLLSIDRSVAPIQDLQGGTDQARECLSDFLRTRLPGYVEQRRDPNESATSHLSAYLHFGQIGVHEVAQKVLDSASASSEDKAGFLEELVVRRELAINHVWYNPDYDRFKGLPDWARQSLAEHADDDRPHRYSRKELEQGRTHDRYWNAAMLQMRHTGYLHNHMRMYWGKKVLEWCNTPEYAHRTLLYLNNRYFLDGRDANSYANVGWIFGLHDRGWTERSVFGKVRYMNAHGLERKFDVERWAEQIEARYS